MDIAAPGVNVYSTYKNSDTSYSNMSGTSMASPHVAGAAALYRAANPGKSQAEVVAALVGTVKDVEVQGRDNNTGAGLLDIQRALMESQPTQKVAPAAPAVPTAVAGDGSVTLSWSAVTASGAAPVSGYRVYREGVQVSATSDGAGTGTLPFTDTAVTNGTTYSYEVTAHGEGGESGRSLPVTAKPAATLMAPAAPASATATAGDGTASVSWSPVTATSTAPVAGYRVYRNGAHVTTNTGRDDAGGGTS